MLSKIEWYEDNVNFEKEDDILLFQNLYNQYHKDTLNIDKKLNTGTLGLVYLAYIENKRYIVKTHQNGIKYANRIKKEYSILNILYNDNLKCKLYSNDEGLHNFLLLEFLSNFKVAVSAEQLINYYNNLSIDLIQLKNIKCEWNFYDLQKKFFFALTYLYDKKFLSDKQYGCIFRISPIIDAMLKEDSCLCHGDLSNKNIFQKNSQILFLDWEDAFYGVREYDICYWFTFFENRKLLNKIREIYSGYNFDRALTLCIMVLILKAYLSVLNGSYKNNTLSIEDRIQEFLEL